MPQICYRGARESVRVHTRRLAITVFLTLSLPCWAGPEIEDFLRDADVRDAALSPDGTHLAMVINQDNTRSVIVRNIQDPEMPIVGAFSNDITRPNYLYWGNNDRLLIALSVPYDIERVQEDKEKESDFDINDYFMFSRMIATGKDLSNSTVLMEGERKLRTNISLSRVTNFLPEDVDHILMAAYRGDRRTQYRVNIVTGAAEEITRGSSRTFRFLNDEDGSPRYRFDYRPRSEAIVIYEYDDDGDWEKLEKIYLNKDDEDSIDTAGLIGLYGDSLVYRKRNENTGYYELLVANSDSDEVSTLVSLPEQDVLGVLYDTRADQIAGYTIEQDYERHVYFDAAMQAQYDAISAQVGSANFEISDLSREGKIALIRSWRPDDPLSYYLWNADTEELQLLVHAYQGLAATELSLPAMTSYKARDGQLIRAYLLLPRDYEEGTRYPTVVLPHGGPHSRSRPTYDDFAQFLSTRGYIVVQPNFRGSVGYGREFEEAGYKQWGGLMQDDVTDAVHFMVEKGLTDPDRVCIVGASYGGYAALMGAIKTPDLFQCAISLNGVTHLEKILEYDMRKVIDKEDWQRLLFDRIGHPKDDREMLDANSPALNADKIRIPILLVAGTADDVVPFSQATRMEKALKKAGVQYEFISLRNTGHNPFYYKEDIEEVFNAVEAFLQENLQ